MDYCIGQKALKKLLYLKLIEEKIINNAAALHMSSKLEAQQARKWRFRPPVSIIPNSIDLAKYKKLPPRGKLRETLKLPADASVSLFVGRLHKTTRLPFTI